MDRLPEDIVELIGRLRRSGRTIDEIMGKLEELPADALDGEPVPSRSALGRHVKRIADVGARIRESRAVAQALVAQFGEEPDNRLARANLELMHDMVMRTITAAQIDEATGEAAEVVFDPEQVMFLSRSLQSLASAQKTDSDRHEKALAAAEAKAKKEAAAAVDRVVKRAEGGFSRDTIAAIKQEILRVG